jgi:putative hydrolase of the HAD superfamily
MALKAVIWDMGGVLTSSPFDGFTRYEVENGLPKDLIRRVNATNPDTNAWSQLERNAIDAGEFDKAFLLESTALGHPLRGQVVLQALTATLRPRMVAALGVCKRRYKVGCITNNMAGPGDGPHAGERPLGPMTDLMAQFDHVIESYKAGVRKPDPRIYLMMCEALDVAPQDCVYLDDLGVNCKPAAQLGMKAIKVLNEDQALADLAAATGLEFDLSVAG